MIQELLEQEGIEYADKIARYLEQRNIGLANIDNLPIQVSGSSLYGQNVYQLVQLLREAYATYAQNIPAAKQDERIDEETDIMAMLDDKTKALLEEAGYDKSSILTATYDGLTTVTGIGPKTANHIINLLEEIKQ